VSTRRDYKRTATGQRRRQTVRRHGLLVVTLVLIGLFGGLLAYIKGDRSPHSAPMAGVAPAATVSVHSPTPSSALSPPATAVSAPVAEPTPIRPKYDFYTELPKRQIDIQREETHPRNVPPAVPNRMRPASDPLRKPTAPRKNATSPTVASPTAHSAKPKAPNVAVPTVAKAKPARAQQKAVQPLAHHDPTIIVKAP